MTLHKMGKRKQEMLESWEKFWENLTRKRKSRAIAAFAKKTYF